MKEREFLVCECHSLEHTIVVWWNEEDKLIYTYIHLNTNKNFLQRLWIGIKYIFGHKSRFGSWDEFIFSEEAEESLHKYIENARNSRSKTH